MRIAFLLNFFPKTSETFILNQIVGLIERGHTVDIFARYPDIDDPVHSDVKKYKLIDQTRYLAIARRSKPASVGGSKNHLKVGLGQTFAFAEINQCIPMWRGSTTVAFGCPFSGDAIEGIRV